VLVAADGANSAVRRQYLPDARRVDTGVVAVAGKLPLTEQAKARLPERLRTGVSNILPAGEGFLFVAVWEGDRRAAAALGPDGAPARSGGLLLDNTQDYPADVVTGGDGAVLQQVVASAIDGWHPDLTRMVTSSDPSRVAPVIVRSMAPVPAWTTTSITLIGDAIHNMTPMAGIGANTALRDAALLRDKLIAAHRGETDLLAAIHDYETQMLDYGFAALKLSLRNAQPNWSATADHGRTSTTSRSPSPSTSTGSTIAGSTARSASSHRSSTRPLTAAPPSPSSPLSGSSKPPSNPVLDKGTQTASRQAPVSR